MRRRESECGGEAAEQEKERDGCLEPHRLISPPVLSGAKTTRREKIQVPKSTRKRRIQKHKAFRKSAKKKTKNKTKNPDPKNHTQGSYPLTVPHTHFLLLQPAPLASMHSIDSGRLYTHGRAKREIPHPIPDPAGFSPSVILYVTREITSGRINTQLSSQTVHGEPSEENGARVRDLGRLHGGDKLFFF